MKEKLYVDINGIKQGMFLHGAKVENPVLLFLHGGPGSPEVAFTDKYPTGLEKLFTVCWWEQRGSGMSYSSKIKKEEMTIDNMISDTIEVANYLRKRFNKEKIYVMGHSWGSFLGMLTVQQAPEIFHGYIGVGQVAKQDESERLAYTYMLDKFSNENNKKMVKKLEKYSIDKGGEISNKYLGTRSQGMMKLGIGLMHNCTSMMECVKVVLNYKGYTMREKMKYPLGNGFSLKCLWDYVIKTDLIELVPEVKVPVYIFQGKFDYQVSYVIAKEFIKKLKAPQKGFYTFENSAHSPCFEEAEKMCKILSEDVLQGKVDLSDNI